KTGILPGYQFCRATIRKKSHSMAGSWLRNSVKVTSSTPVIRGFANCRRVFLEHIGYSRICCPWENERKRRQTGCRYLAQSIRTRNLRFRSGGGLALPLHTPVFVNRLDYLVLFATILAIPLYGLWRTRGSASLGQYLKGDASIQWA